MSTLTSVYSGDFNGQSAGANGLSILLTGDPLPSNAIITSIAYEQNISAGNYSSSKEWCLHHFYLNNGSPYADEDSIYMRGTSGTLSGNMHYGDSDSRIFNGTVTLHAKANTNHSATSYMRAVRITVSYRLSYDKPTCSLSNSSIAAGENSVIKFSGDDIANIYHEVKWSIGSYSNTATTNKGETSLSFTVPVSWVNAITNSTSGTVVVEVSGYSSYGLVGTTTLRQTLTVPSDIVPILTGVSATRINNSVPEEWDIYVQGKSGIKLTAEGAEGAYGSTIASYLFSGAVNATASSNTFTLSRIDDSGDQTFEVFAVDSRGRQSEPASVTINVIPYSPPTSSHSIAERCLADGTANEDGTYISVKLNGSYDSLDGQNSLSADCVYQKVGESSWTTGLTNLELNTPYVIGNGDIDTNYSYQVKFILKDAFSTTEKIVGVGTASYIIFYRKDGTGVGIGKVCENDHSFEINPDWAFMYGTVDVGASLANIPRIVYTTGSTPSGSEGMIWLKKL